MADYNNLMDYMEQLDPDELIEVMNDVQKMKTASGKILYCPVYDKREKQLFQRYQETNNVNFISEAFAMEVKRNKNVNMYGLDSWIKLSSTTHYSLLGPTCELQATYDGTKRTLPPLKKKGKLKIEKENCPFSHQSVLRYRM